jgi:hypothetical protein
MGGQAYQAFEHGHAQIHDDTVRHPRQRVLGDKGQYAAQQKDADHGERVEPELTRIGKVVATIEQRLHQGRKQGFDGGREHHAEDGHQKNTPIGTDMVEQAEVDLAASERAVAAVPVWDLTGLLASGNVRLQQSSHHSRCSMRSVTKSAQPCVR